MQFLRIDGNFVPSFKPLFQNGRFRPNLTVFTGAYATRVMLEGARAAGIEYKCRGAIQKVRADREVVVSAGAFATCSTV